MKPTQPEWEPMHERASVVAPLKKGQWHVENIRDFVYTPDSPPEYRWSTRTIDISDVRAGYFYVMPIEQFGEIGKLFAHTCLGFSFKDGTDLLYSIEARQPIGEEYRPGSTSQNIRIFATLDYFKGFRHFVRKQGFSRYRLTIEHDVLPCLLQACLEDACDACTNVDQYHPVKNQCTTALLMVMNRGLKHPVPWHPYWHFTRLTHRFLATRGLIDLAQKELL